MNVILEAFLDAGWTDITRLDDDTRLLGDDRDGGILISRGGSDEQGEPTATTITFDYLDNNATLDEDNYLSPYYGQIVVGTPLRVVLPDFDNDVRAVVELASLTPNWVDGQNIVTVATRAASLLERLQDGQKPLRDPFTRAILASNPKAFWPLNEGSESTRFASALTGGSPLINSGLSPGSVSGPNGDESFPDVASGGDPISATGPMVTGISASGWTVEFIAYIGEAAVEGEHPDLIVLQWTVAGSGLWRAFLGVDSSTGPYVIVTGFVGITDASVYNTSRPDFGWNHVRLTFEQSGGNVVVTLYINGIADGGTADSSTVGTLGAPSGTVIVGQTVPPIVAEYFSEASVGMVAFYDLADGVDHSAAALGYIGETAGNRMIRLALEEGVSLTVEGDPDDSAPLDVQGTDTFLQLLRDAATTDLGILADDRSADSFAWYRTRRDLYNQVPTCRLTYAHLSPGFRPAADTVRLVNDITVDRPNAGSARYAIPDDDPWHRTTQDPPDGARIRDGQASAKVATDDALIGNGAWRVHQAAWREKRYTTVGLDLSRSAFDSDDIGFVLNLDLGDVLTIDTSDDAPRWVTYDEVRLVVRGYTELINKFRHAITFSTTPADVYEVGYVDSGPTSRLANPVDDNDTSIKIAPSGGPAWSEVAADLPYHIRVGGQPMTVAAISTDTVAHIATGAASYADNGPVTPALPVGITPDVGQLLVILASGRGGGVPAPQLPANWTEIFADGDTKLFGRYYVTGVVAPAVTFSGGNTGDTTGAQMAAFSGLSMTLDKNKPAGYPLGYVISTNGSAQNIAYPAYLNRRTKSAMLIVGTKRDDWTSVATIAGTSELGDSSSTTGGDAGMVWDLYNPGTPTTVVAGSFVVTGGASANSKGIVVGLRPLQTATVTRGIDGPAAAISVDAEIRGWRMGVNAL